MLASDVLLVAIKEYPKLKEFRLAEYYQQTTKHPFVTEFHESVLRLSQNLYLSY